MLIVPQVRHHSSRRGPLGRGLLQERRLRYQKWLEIQGNHKATSPDHMDTSFDEVISPHVAGSRDGSSPSNLTG